MSSIKQLIPRLELTSVLHVNYRESRTSSRVSALISSKIIRSISTPTSDSSTWNCIHSLLDLDKSEPIRCVKLSHERISSSIKLPLLPTK